MTEVNIKRNTRAICEGAIFIALSLAMCLVELKIWPQGGSVDFVMVPLIIFALRWGTGWGIGAGIVSGVLNGVIVEGMAFGGWQALILDYAIAYGCCGMAGIFHSQKWRAEVGTVISCAARFICHLISGVVLWASHMPKEFMGMIMNNVWIYSALYNVSYMLPNMILALIAIILLKVPLGKYLKAEDIN